MKDLFLEKYFSSFRKNTVGVDQIFKTPFGEKTIHYFDWTASGRLYSPIEDALKNTFGAYVGNTHSESTETGMDMTIAYQKSREIIKNHVNAGKNDVILMVGSGATGAINKLQRILGLKYWDQVKRLQITAKQKKKIDPLSYELKPVVFISHMEHHSNQITWLEGGADIVIVPIDKKGIMDLEILKKLLKKYKNRKIKIGSFTACSNVTGILNPIYKLAEIMHKNGGLCFIDFAAAAPYIKIDMNPPKKAEKLDAIFMSPHKFLGGPATPGVLIFDKKLYPTDISPENPGGGTVRWTNPWGGIGYYDEIETREDGGTPAFLQTVKAALCINLKMKMGIKNILKREEHLLEILFAGLRKTPGVHILDDIGVKRLGIVSFYIGEVHYNLVVKLLNDRYGIQTRGGCSCAGTYGHMLLHIDEETSNAITCEIDKGNYSTKPGWVRVSLHPTITDKEVSDLIQALEDIAKNHKEWGKDYVYSSKTNEFHHKNFSMSEKNKKIDSWFSIS